MGRMEKDYYSGTLPTPALYRGVQTDPSAWAIMLVKSDRNTWYSVYSCCGVLCVSLYSGRLAADVHSFQTIYVVTNINAMYSMHCPRRSDGQVGLHQHQACPTV